MAVGPETAGALLDALASYDGPVVADPVLATSRGGALWGAEPGALLPLLATGHIGDRPTPPRPRRWPGMPVATAAQAEAAGRALVDGGWRRCW